MTSALDTLSLTSFGGSETKKLIQKLSFEFIPESGWYSDSGGHGSMLFGNGDQIRRGSFRRFSILSLSCPTSKNLSSLSMFPFPSISANTVSIDSAKLNDRLGSRISAARDGNICSPGSVEMVRASMGLLGPPQLDGLIEAQALLRHFRSKTNVRVE